MMKIRWMLVVAVLAFLPLAAGAQEQARPAWAFPVLEDRLPAEEPGPKTVPDSNRTFELEQIENLSNPPDWFPDEHAPAPAIVRQGHGAALACGSCHLMSGLGHPESAGLTGFTAAYIVQQMADFKSGARIDSSRMNAIAAEVSDDEAREAAEWFASLGSPVGTRVIEAAMVPATFVGQGRMRFLRPGGAMEPIGNRIITLPEDQGRARLRDPHSGFYVYAPPGSIARGKALVETGDSGRILSCTICHGDTLRGLGNVPRLADLHPIYAARQLYLFKDGSRNGVDSELMDKAVANLTDEDIVAIVAYLGSLKP